MKHLDFKYLREKMVDEQLIPRGISDQRTLSVFRNIPRELFVPQEYRHHAYRDQPLPIGLNQTISQPYIVALMTRLLAPQETDKILEIGTGSGYQAAILSQLANTIYSIERHASLAEAATQTLKKLKCNVCLRIGDGTMGLDEFSPYDKIIVTAATQKVPPPLMQQLKTGGILVIPLGNRLCQDLTVITKISAEKNIKEKKCECIFVPLIGKYSYEKFENAKLF